MCDPDIGFGFLGFLLGPCIIFLALGAAARVIQTHHPDHPLGTLIPSSRLGLTEGRSSRGVLDVNQICAGATGEVD